MSKGNGNVPGRAPWIERAEADATLAPFNSANGVTPPSEHYAAKKVCQSGRRTNRKRCLKNREGAGTIVTVHPDAKRSTSKREGIVLTMQEGSLCVAN
jgi:hypothetical protein